MMKYLGFTTFTDVVFAFFMVSWIVTRQILFSLVLVSTYKVNTVIPYKWDPQAGHYLTPTIYVGFLTLPDRSMFPRIVGAKGSNVARLRNESGADITVSHEDSTIVIVGECLRVACGELTKC